MKPQCDSCELHRHTGSPTATSQPFFFWTHAQFKPRADTVVRVGDKIATSPGCTLSLRLPLLLLLLLPLLRYRAPAASSGLAPAGKPAPPATPAPPRPPPVSDRDASFCGQEEPAAPAARLLSESHFIEARKHIKQPHQAATQHQLTRTSLSGPAAGETLAPERALSLTLSLNSQRLERLSDTPDSRVRVCARARVNQCASLRVSWTLLKVCMGEHGAPPADTHNDSTKVQQSRIVTGEVGGVGG